MYLDVFMFPDDVFDYMLNIRTLNAGIDQRREEMFQEYLDAKYSDFQMKYDLDEDPVDVKRWTELETVRTYWEFFQQHRKEFD